jgi:hypothetical protein
MVILVSDGTTMIGQWLTVPSTWPLSTAINFRALFSTVSTGINFCKQIQIFSVGRPASECGSPARARNMAVGDFQKI